LGIRQRLRQCRRRAAEEVKEDEPRVAHRVFHVVSEYPEIKHIADQVKKAAMQEHGSEYRRYRRDEIVVGRQALTAEKCRRDHAEARYRRLESPLAERELPEKNDRARNDQRDIDDRRRPTRHIVAQRNHDAAPPAKTVLGSWR